MPKVKFIPCKLLLKMLNDESLTSGFNKNLTDKELEQISEAAYPIPSSTLHEYIYADAMRCEVILNEKADFVYLDIPMERFNELPEVEIE